MKNKKQKGFSLVELLVVIAIIGILSTLAVIYLGGASEKARDSKRIDDITKLANAMELYKQETGTYLSGYNNCLATGLGFRTDLKPLVTQGLIGEIPCDPVEETFGHGSTYYYFRRATPITWWGNAHCGNIGVDDFEYFFLFTPERTMYDLLPFGPGGPITDTSCGPGISTGACCVIGPKK